VNELKRDRLVAREGTPIGPENCNLCGGAAFTPLVERWGLKVIRCGDCGLAFTYPLPEEITSQYDKYYFELYARRSEFRRRRMARRLRCIETLISPGRVLDIGCSLGYFLEVAQRSGWAAYGTDISSFAIAHCKLSGLDVRQGSLADSGFEGGFFNCVTMWDVLEHVPDPTAHMLEVNRVLRPGGLAVIGTPDISHLAFKIKKREWRHLKPAEHLYYFSRSTIRTLFEKSGFRQVWPKVTFSAGASCLSSVLRQYAGNKLRLNDVLVAYGIKTEYVRGERA
jgi:SAM-dependent methyltransferase